MHTFSLSYTHTNTSYSTLTENVHVVWMKSERRGAGDEGKESEKGGKSVLRRKKEK
jgi:hypothetical protein